ncbi:unnamed protein product [Thlaspi arvense]|uniref:F-box/LRR-repeat protein 15/At3g58940/PEG3-like LRR domain-containing protein n=1 Tax=Thlaspi arvense TaxID=13288 RepID=A0AAU9S526_THLAR|nr:unnamed protein product [Thlaspi arvense]
MMWIKLAMSRNVESMSLEFGYHGDHKYHVPEFFYINNSVKQLSVQLRFYGLTIPSCSVSWTSLKMLSLRCCTLSDEDIDKILSGCPILESLKLYFCDNLGKSQRLRTLEIDRNIWVPVRRRLLRRKSIASDCATLSYHMLDKLQNVDKLTFGANFLEILSIAELRGVPLPSFKETYIDDYLNSRGLNPDQCWSWEARAFEKVYRWNVESKHVASFMELMLKSTKTLEKMVVRLKGYLERRRFEELLEMVPMLSHNNNNVSIVLSS